MCRRIKPVCTIADHDAALELIKSPLITPRQKKSCRAVITAVKSKHDVAPEAYEGFLRALSIDNLLN